VELSPAGVIDWARSPEGQKLVRYSIVSVISVIVSQTVLFSLQLTTTLRVAWVNIIACGVATVPSYELNRKWAWGKSGRGHLWREVVPFWGLAFLGLAFSEWAVVVANHWARDHELARVYRSAVVNASALAAFGVLWVAKFVIFNKVLFAHHEQDLDPAFDGRTGLPT
jgi:putative flippase GtrA